jgi:3-hydroxyacyl-[acyl-carrier-protein] dehydratase
MRYQLIDRILEFEAGRRIRAVKAVAASEEYFRDHFAGNAVMPGALIIEAAAQAGTALIELTHQCRVKAFLTFVHEAKFRTLVRPGETMFFSLEIDNMSTEFARVRCDIESALPDATRIRSSQMDLTFGIRPVGEFYSEAAQQYIQSGYDELLRGTAHSVRTIIEAAS